MKPIFPVPVAKEPQMGPPVPLATSVRIPIMSPGVNRNSRDYTYALNRELDYETRKIAAALQVPADHLIVDQALDLGRVPVVIKLQVLQLADAEAFRRAHDESMQVQLQYEVP